MSDPADALSSEKAAELANIFRFADTTPTTQRILLDLDEEELEEDTPTQPVIKPAPPTAAPTFTRLHAPAIALTSLDGPLAALRAASKRKAPDPAIEVDGDDDDVVVVDPPTRKSMITNMIADAIRAASSTTSSAVTHTSASVTDTSHSSEPAIKKQIISSSDGPSSVPVAVVSTASPTKAPITALPKGKARVVNPAARRAAAAASSSSAPAAASQSSPVKAPTSPEVVVDRSPIVLTNRAPVLAMWAACAACAAYDMPWPIATTVGHALMSVCMEGAATHLGILDAETVQKRNEASDAAGPSSSLRQKVQVLGVDVEVLLDGENWGPALLHGRPQDTAEAVRYMQSKFGARYAEVKEAFMSLAQRCAARVVGNRFTPEEDFLKFSGAFVMYEDFRPPVAAGVRGWGQVGRLNLSIIRDLP